MQNEADDGAIRVLLVEDNPLDAELTLDRVREEGFPLYCDRVESEGDYLNALKSAAWDLIIADYNLPSFDGLKAVDIAQKIAPETPLILVSGTMGDDLVVEGLRRGASDFVLKSRLERLPIAIRRAMRERDVRNAKLKAEADMLCAHRRLKILRKVDLAICGSFDLRLTAQIVLRELKTELGVDAAALLLHDRHEMALTYVSGVGFATNALQYTRLRIGEGYAGKAAQTRQEVYIEDVRQSSGTFFRLRQLSEEGFVSYLAVPLIAKGHVEGVLEIFQREPLIITPDWHEFLDSLAGQTAIAIDNAELYSGLEMANAGLRHAYDQTLEGWVHALDIRDKETEGHSQRVTEMTVALARAFGIGGEPLSHIRRGALLHDIGKLGIPDSIMLKKGTLTDEEWVVMKKHPVYAFEWLSPIEYLKPAIDIPYCHHERWDGSGYPRGLKGDVIPEAARFFAVVDVWDALRSDRPYRKAWSEEDVIEHITSLAGTHFAPAAVEAFLSLDLGRWSPSRKGHAEENR